MSADARREKLVEAAIEVMKRDGVARTTTRAIVAEAEMPLGVFHYCFRSKQELLEQVIEAITAHSLDRVTAIAEHRTSVRDTLQASLRGYWEHVVANPAEHMLTYELTQYALRQPGFEDVARKQYAFYVRTLEGFLDQTSGALGVRFRLPTSVLARYIFTVLDGLTLNWVILGDDDQAEAVLDEVVAHVAGLAEPQAQRSTTG